ncbi:MAG: hypothetical protein LBT54_05810 [Bifidobacteriaceae bacterium]|nr:hypothetical protein [Bifidobacteriaceae bacterium]
MGKGSRRARREREGHPELDLARARGGFPVREQAEDGDWIVRASAPAEKEYVCPGCRQVIARGAANTVAWRAEGLLGDDAALEDRRHWHPACWRARARRR